MSTQIISYVAETEAALMNRMKDHNLLFSIALDRISYEVNIT